MGNEVRESEKVRKGLTSKIRKSVKIRIWERKLIYYYLSIITYLLLFNYNYKLIPIFVLRFGP